MISVGRDPFLRLGLLHTDVNIVDGVDALQLLDQPGRCLRGEVNHRQQAFVFDHWRVDALRHDEVAVALLLADAVGGAGVAGFVEQDHRGVAAHDTFDCGLPFLISDFNDLWQHTVCNAGVIQGTPHTPDVLRISQCGLALQRTDGFHFGRDAA